MQPKKQLKVQYIGIFEEIDFLLTKNALLEKGPKSSGLVRPPSPLIQAMHERKQNFSLDVFHNLSIISVIHFSHCLCEWNQGIYILQYSTEFNSRKVLICVKTPTKVVQIKKN